MPGSRVRLGQVDPRGTPGFAGPKRTALEATARFTGKLAELQELLYADRRQKVLVVLQALDTGGKDGTIRRVFEGVNPQGVRVAKFVQPTPDELAHDFLWRVHRQVPVDGEIVIFNRSHYEDVLVVRVDRLVPRAVWSKRYDAINEFERNLTEERTTVLKFFLLISREEQARRLQERLDDPTKHWKLSPTDLEDRRAWNRYVPAIEEMLERTSSAFAPWYLIPSDRKWYRDYAITSILVESLAGLKLRWPKLPAGLAKRKIPPAGPRSANARDRAG